MRLQNNGNVLFQDENELKFMDILGRIKSVKEIPHPELLANKLMYGRVGVRKKPCICTFPDGTERTFADIQSAGDYMNIAPQNISACCNGHINSAAGCKWRYAMIEDNLGMIDNMLRDVERLIDLNLSPEEMEKLGNYNPMKHKKTK